MCVCVCVCVIVGMMYVCMHVCVRFYMNVLVYICCVCVHVCVCACAWLIFFFLFKYLWMHVFLPLSPQHWAVVCGVCLVVRVVRGTGAHLCVGVGACGCFGGNGAIPVSVLSSWQISEDVGKFPGLCPVAASCCWCCRMLMLVWPPFVLCTCHVFPCVVLSFVSG